MKKLNREWLTENLIDFEYKQYVLLAYLEEVSRQFDQKLLYPSLAELIDHYRHLKQFRSNADSLYNSFRENLEGIDLENFRLSYQKVVQNDALMQEISQIVEFSIPQFEQKVQLGREIYEVIEQHLTLEPVGLVPLNSDSGYLIIELKHERESRVYEYSVSLFDDNGEKMRAMHTSFRKSFSNSPFVSPQNLKLDLIRENRDLPNPATFLVTSELRIPFDATYFPIAKRMLMKELSGAR